MADIDIVPKQRSNIWIWIVLAIVVLLALYFLFGAGTNEVRSGAAYQQMPATASVIDTVASPVA